MSYPTIWQTAVAATAIKILLFPAYKSTDFEVHRNWLAITHSLPVKQWYFENASQWTLDYPPFFAYFEWLLSQLARFADAKMLLVENLNYDSWQTIYFQRFTVILSELTLLYALCLFAGRRGPRKSYNAAAISIILSPGLLMIDHIHFQYNGFLFGILILSMTLAEHDSTRLMSCILFAALLCFKHIFLYLAPAYAVYILRVYCLQYPSYYHIHFSKSFKLGIALVTIFALASGPFLYMGQMQQLLSRLFPFSRGLCHAYWAPNFWALYSFVDRILLLANPILKFNADPLATDKLTRGLVGNTSFGILPQISPKTTFLITLLVQIASLLKLFITPQWNNFVISITLCSYASFLFGWHVHEKAVLLIIIPFSLIAFTNKKYLGPFQILSFAGYFAITPLLFGVAEAPIKVLLVSFWILMTLKVSSGYLRNLSNRLSRSNMIPLAYASGIFLLSGYCSILHHIIFGDQLEFLPLMLTSTYSAVGVLGSWLWTLHLYLVAD